jgi:alpha-ketoglutarate-dependent taurine dioxygenase
MQTKLLGPGFAVEVSGIDPSRPASDAQAAELRALLDEHELLVLRAPGLDADAHVAFMSLFGPVYDEYQDKSGLSYVSNVIGAFPNGRLLFHQDFAFTPYPHRVQSLYAQEVQGAVSPTLFVSNSRAYGRLTPAQREAWQGLTAVHARNAGKSGRDDDEFVRVELHKLPNNDDVKLYPRASHPVLSQHPRTGAPLLFVNEYYTSHIPELTPEAGEQVIQDACALMYQPDTIYSHEWRPGDLVVWDNIALQHARSEVKPNTRRTLRRILINDHVQEPGFRESAGLTYAG